MFVRCYYQRLIVQNISAFFVQGLGLMISTLLLTPNPVWFASGTACAMVFIRGYRVLPGITAGCFLMYYLTSHQLMLSCECAAVFTIQTALLLWITHRYINPSLIFYHSNRLIKFCISSAAITALGSFALILFCAKSYSLWPQWWLANFNGVLIVAIAWVTTDAFYTYGGKSFGEHVRWCKTIRGTFLIALILNMAIYLHLPGFASMPLSTLIILQLLLSVGTLSGLYSALC